MSLTTTQLRQVIRDHYLADEHQILSRLMQQSALTQSDRASISANAADLVSRVRTESTPSLMEKFLAEYGLTTKEGVALMCLAEALLRVPDNTTIDDLIEDKVATGNWKEHLGQSASSLVNSSTWALLVTGKLLQESEHQSLQTHLRGMFKRLGEPLIRKAVGQAMKELGRQFVLGQTIESAAKRATKLESKGYTYSYDMLGEAARTDADALRYHAAYSDAISGLTPACVHKDIRQNPGISVKLSALHPRYEMGQKARVMEELVERTLSLALQAKQANMGFNIDAEEADRLDLSLDVIEAVLADERLKGWTGFGVVVQAFGQRASYVLDWLHTLATQLDRQIMVRLVKGAYWDAEIKRAQVLGLESFPVYTRKVNSDLSYMCCAEKLMTMTDRIYPQFATHNAHSTATVLYLAKKHGVTHFEFQRLHGMGESLHDEILTTQGTRCRIYAPVGAHEDLLAYLVRRLLENGANSSFVNQIVDHRIAPQEIAKDPFDQVQGYGQQVANPAIVAPLALFGEGRLNAKGWDITDPTTLARLEPLRDTFAQHKWRAKPMIAGLTASGEAVEVRNPANPDDVVGYLSETQPAEIEAAISAARLGFGRWRATSAHARAKCLRKVADLFEAHTPELMALACREAGKTLLDAVGEVREAVDFARYYANQAEKHALDEPRGVLTCISPWNFPLAIFSGQVLAAVAAGNSVLAKPADQTPLIAARAVALMHEAGIPVDVIQLLPGSGLNVGVPLTSDERIAGVCFTGSTATAQHINRAMAANMAPQAPLVAETGGMNAMIVDSTALPEQVVRDVLMSAFQSAGQRCSALRVLYLQEDIAHIVLPMLYGAMDELRLGNPWLLSSDIGPVIDVAAQQKITQHIAKYEASGRLLKSVGIPSKGTYVAPTVLKIDGIAELDEEIFGPVLHVATFAAGQLDNVVDAINAKGFGLTFGLHTRVDNRVEQVVNRINVGNVYVNRNQIGAIVGSQPFGGEGLSGTGPKAGGPHYVKRFTQPTVPAGKKGFSGSVVSSKVVAKLVAALDTTAWQSETDPSARLSAFSGVLEAVAPQRMGALGSEEMPGPTGELNLLSHASRGVVLCLGPDLESAKRQAVAALLQGNGVVMVSTGVTEFVQQCQQYGLPVQGANGMLDEQGIIEANVDAMCCNGNPSSLATVRKALAQRDGALIPLITEWNQPERFVLERHLCIDTTAAGGNASLIASV